MGGGGSTTKLGGQDMVSASYMLDDELTDGPQLSPEEHFEAALALVNELDANVGTTSDGTPLEPDEMVAAQGGLLKQLERHKGDALACAALGHAYEVGRGGLQLNKKVSDKWYGKCDLEELSERAETAEDNAACLTHLARMYGALSNPHSFLCAYAPPRRSSQPSIRPALATSPHLATSSHAPRHLLTPNPTNPHQLKPTGSGCRRT